jgi:tetratricopeptide (TPR) repeat protein
MRAARTALLMIACAFLNAPADADFDHGMIGKLAQQGKNAEGMKLCAKLMAKDPHDSVAAMFHALFRYWGGDSVGGTREMEGVANAFPNAGGPRAHLANMNMAAGKIDAALSLAQQAQRLSPEDGGPPTIIAHIYMLKHNYADSLRYVQLALQAPERGNPALVNSCKLASLVALGRLDDARAFANTIDMKTLRWSEIDGVANDLMTKGQVDRVTLLEGWSHQYGKTTSALYLLASTNASANHISEAEKFAKQLWKLNPNDVDGRVVMAQMYKHNGLYREAAACLDAIPHAAWKEKRDLWTLAYDVHCGEQEYERAIADLNQMMIFSNPIEKVNLLAKRAHTYSLTGDTTHALADYTRAIRANPTKAEFYRKRAELYEELNNCTAAQADYKRASLLGK